MAAPPTDPTAAYRAQQGLGAVTQSYDPKLVGWIVQAAKATGADPRALLATSLQESGARLNGPAGDKGTSFGPFQFHIGGALANHSPAWANTYDAVLNRAQEFHRLNVHGGPGAAAVQGPLDKSLYAQGVNHYLDQAGAILAHFDPSLVPDTKVDKKTLRTLATPADTSPDSADEGPLNLMALQALHRNAQIAHLPGSGGAFTGNLLQDTLNSNADIAGLTAPTLPMPTAATPAATVPATTPATTPKSPAMPSTPLSPLGKPGGGWGGSLNLANAMKAIGGKNGLSVVSAKRDRMHTSSGGVSDHWTGSKTSYAYDLSNGGKPTPQMDATALQIATALGAGAQWQKQGQAGVLNVNKGGYRYQMLYRTNVGGNHFNHVHIGVRKL